MSWKDANTRQKNKNSSHFRDRAVLLLSQLGQLQAVSLAGGEQMNLLRYLDSIVDCNKETCSQKVYAKIFLISGFHIPQILT